MSAITATLLLAAIIALTAMSLLVVLTIAIHKEEQHASLSAAPRTRTERLARRVLGRTSGNPHHEENH